MHFALRLIAKLPLRVLHGLGTLLGWLVFLLSPTYRTHFRSNVERARLSQDQVRSAIGSAGQMLAELPWVWLRGAEERRAAVHWVGLPLIEANLARGKGLIYLTPHMGCFELLPAAHGLWLGERHGPITVLFRPPRSRIVAELFRRSRSVPGVNTAPTTTAGVRSLLRALKNGQAVGLLPDQVPELGLGVWAPFFGQPAYTMTLALRLARRSGAPVMLVYGERLAQGQGYLIHVRDMEQNLKQTDEQLAADMNVQLERLILDKPSLYFWGYARYKQPVPKKLRVV